MAESSRILRCSPVGTRRLTKPPYRNRQVIRQTAAGLTGVKWMVTVDTRGDAVDDNLNSQLKDELREISENIDTIIERIRALDPAVDHNAETEEPAKPES